MDSLDKTKKWSTHITVKEGEYLHGGDIFAEVPETRAIVHKCMIPPDVEGTVVSVAEDGDYTIEETLIVVEGNNGKRTEVAMAQKWPIRTARPVRKQERKGRHVLTAAPYGWTAVFLPPSPGNANRRSLLRDVFSCAGCPRNFFAAFPHSAERRREQVSYAA